nr:transcription repressor OFP6-like [Ipomoea batatas]GMC89402.1 transcription repressor OFP6-like [Ipomoea batatas]
MDEGKEQWEENSEIKSLRAVKGFGRFGGESVAVEKDSDDPYLDFWHSMLQMILEKNIYSKDDLKELLNCFLQLNSPYYHGVIVRAFREIWNDVFSVKPPDYEDGDDHAHQPAVK